MKIKKILNNNFLLVTDDSEQEVIVMSKGIGFNQKVGNILDAKLFEKKFVLNNTQTISTFEQLIEQIPLEYFDVASKLVNEFKLNLSRKFKDNLVFTLADHIYFAVYRHQNNQYNTNGLLFEIARIYPEEFAVAKKAVAYLHEQFEIPETEDEAAFIVMHIINASTSSDFNEIRKQTLIINEIIEIVETNLGKPLDVNSVDYYRFMTHMKFLVQRLLEKQTYAESDSEKLMFQKIMQDEPHLSKIVDLIATELEAKFEYELNDSECFYLLLHIKRLNKNI